MNPSWYAVNVSQLVGVAVTAVGLYAVVVVLIRINGLRSLTKMSSIDFVTTVAIGSLLATVVLSDSPSLAQGAAGLVMLFLIQGGFSWVRRRIPVGMVENEPILLMDGATILDENMARSRVTRDDLYAKLREANVLNLDQVRAVVLESTGDVSVLHGQDADFDPGMLQGLRDGPDERPDLPAAGTS